MFTIALKIIVFLGIAEIYQIMIMTIINWVDGNNYELYKKLIGNKNEVDGRKVWNKKLKIDFIRHSVAAFIVSGFLAYKTILILW